MRNELVQALLVWSAFGVGCTSQGALPSDGSSGTGGVTASGGTHSTESRNGGTGNSATLGGSSGFSVSTGGASGTGAAGGAGGSVGHAGSNGMLTGGMSAFGGSGGGVTAGASSGGMRSVGGSASGMGGAISAGGASGGTGGASGGAGGNKPSGGAGGAAAGAAGASMDPPCPTETPLTGGKQYCGSSGDGTADGSYTYNLWSYGKGMGCMTVYGVDAAFKATWMNVGDWIGRVGLSFDKSKTYDQLGTFSSDFAYTMTGITTGGFGNIGIYGWTVSPLHEFYIAENWLGKKPNFTKVGSFTIDGEGTYDIMTNQQKNQPNITGTNQDFVQYWSVRTSPRQCGHISVSKHFDEWKSLNLDLGKMEEVRILVEAQNNSGTLDFTKATLVAK